MFTVRARSQLDRLFFEPRLFVGNRRHDASRLAQAPPRCFSLKTELSLFGAVFAPGRSPLLFVSPFYLTSVIGLLPFVLAAVRIDPSRHPAMVAPDDDWPENR